MSKLLAKAPTLYTLEELNHTLQMGVSSSKDGKTYVPARPLGFYSSLSERFRLAKLVFTGKADALVWSQEQ